MYRSGIYKETSFLGGDEFGEHIFILDDSVLQKHAAEIFPAVRDFIQNELVKAPGKTYLHVNAMGAMEAYSCNVNSDGFEEEELIKSHHTFVTNAHPFYSHSNKDPKRALGKVVFSVYNPAMRRVELIVEIDNEKAPDIISSVNNGVMPRCSMGCKVPHETCFPEGTLVRTTNGYTAIEKITPGILVRTHNGRNRTVTSTMERDALAGTVIISSYGVPTIEATPNHPVLALRQDKIKQSCKSSRSHQLIRHKLDGNTCLRCGEILQLEPEWVEAQDLHPGDFLLSPIDGCSPIDTVGIARARMLGYYVGDGHIHRVRAAKDLPYKNVGFAISSNINDTAHNERVLATIKLCELKNDVKVCNRNSKNTVIYTVYGMDFANWLELFGGERTFTKRLHEDVFSWSKEEKLHLLGGYIDTDGHCDKERGHVNVISVNRGLVLDAQRIAHSLGIEASVGCSNKHSATYIHSTTYHLFISGSQSRILAPYSEKISTTYTTDSYPRSFLWNRFWCSSIRSVNEVDARKTVYNLSVEEDESYVAEGVAVHNCSLCGNENKTLQSRCEHLKYKNGTILPDGRKIMAINRNCNFFDISFVTVPADRTATVIAKVASESCGEPHAVIFDVTEKDASEGDPLLLSPPMRSALSVLEAAEPDLPYGTLKAFSTYPLGRLFATLGSLGMVLKPKEFQTVMIIRTGNPDFARRLYSNNLSFAPGGEPIHEKEIDDGWLIDPPLADAMGPRMVGRSAHAPYIAKRLSMISNGSMHGPGPASPLVMRDISSALSGLYSGYRETLMDKIDKLISLLTLLLSDGTIKTGSSVIGQSRQPDYLSKEAGVPDYVKRGLIAFPAAYLAAGYNLEKAKRGEPVGKVGQFILKHPLLLSAAGTAGAKNIVKGVGETVKLFKGASEGQYKFIDALLSKEGGEEMFAKLLSSEEQEEYIMSKVAEISNGV